MPERGWKWSVYEPVPYASCERCAARFYSAAPTDECPNCAAVVAVRPARGPIDLRRHLLEAQAIARVGSWEWDPQRDVVLWTPQLCAIYGVAADGTAMSYQAFLECLPADERDGVAAQVAAAMDGGSSFSVRHRIERHGETARLHGRGRVLRDDAGRVVRMVGTAMDVSDDDSG